MLHWTGCFLAQHTLQDLHWILIRALYLDAAKLVFAVLHIADFYTVNCIVLIYLVNNFSICLLSSYD